MKQVLIALAAAVVVAGCAPESALPQRTGEGSIRMFNAIPTSPAVSFLIEERLIDSVTYKNSSSPGRWDDLGYTFNFQILRPSQLDPERIASQFVQVVRDTEYTLVLGGSIAAPTVNVWEIAERSFADGGTVFELRFGHAASALGPVDVYIGLEGVPPVLGEQAATLAPGEVSAPVDFAADTYVVTLTAVGDPADVRFVSAPAQVLADQSLLFTIFEGAGIDTAPVTIRAFDQGGQVTALTDPRFPPTARFIHGTTDLGTSDIYDDAALLNRIVENLAYGDITADIDLAVGDVPITATAPGNVGAIQFTGTLATIAGGRVNYYLGELAGEIIGTPVRFDRRSIETVARLTFFHSSTNHRSVDVYVVDAGTAIDDAIPRLREQIYLQQIAPIALSAGSYDVYITTSGEKTVLEGPIRLDAALGDVYEAVLLNRVDPSLVELKFFPSP